MKFLKPTHQIWTMGRSRRRFILYFIVLSVFIVTGTILANNTLQKIQEFTTAKNDDVQWNTAQTDVEALEFQMALSSATSGTVAELNNIRHRFDILYSRIDILEYGSNFTSLRMLAEVEKPLAEIVGFIDRVGQFIDADDASLTAALPEIIIQAETLRNNARIIALTSIRHFANKSKLQREAVVDSLTELGTFAISTFLGLVFFLTRLIQANRRSSKKTEQIISAKAHQQSIIGTSIDAIIVTDRAGIIVEYNGAAEIIFGYSPDEALGNLMVELIIPPVDRKIHQSGIEEYFAAGQQYVIGRGLLQIEAMHKSGKVFPVELNISTNKTDDGQLFVAFIRDISSWVEVRSELENARDQALAGEKAKAELLAVMSHEIRTPLNGILGALDLLRNSSLTDRQVKFTTIMKNSGEMLTEHVNNVLDISRADAGKLKMKKRAFDPVELLNDVVEMQHEAAVKRGNSINILTIGGPISLAAGDPTRLRQILVNLIGNAIKFTRDGEIRVEIERPNSGETVVFRVMDTGIGIAEDDYASIFNDFVTLDTSYVREVEGTGLGLAIVQRLVGIMKGKISVESELNVGSTFLVALPLPKVDSVTRDEISEPDAGDEIALNKSLSVLVVEDNDINRLVFREMLTKIGCVVTEASDGYEGVARAAEKLFDLILMDISMPRQDGIAATTKIREVGSLNIDTPILALTAHTLPSDIQRFRLAGMTDVLTKPVSIATLFSVISEVSDKIENEPKLVDNTKLKLSTSNDIEQILGGSERKRIFAQAQIEFDEGLDKLIELADCGDKADEIAFIAHKLSGLAAVIDFNNLGEVFSNIELQARAGDMTNIVVASKAARKMLA